MADQESNDIGVADTSNRMLGGSEPNPIGSTGVRKVDERAEAENLGISSCAVEQKMSNGSEPIVMESTCVAKLDGEVCENLGISGCNIEEGMGSISLVGGFESSGIIGGTGGKGEIKMEEDESESSESESDNPSSATSSSTSSSSSDSDDSSTSGSSSDDDDIEDDKEEGQQEKGEGHTEKIEAEVEEGEIKDSDGQELVTETAASDDDDDEEEEEEDIEVVTGSGINDGEDGAATGGPIRSMNELQNLPPVPPVNVTLGPHHQMLPVGVVMSIISTQVIVEGVEKHDPLNEGSVLWITESRTPLGLVDEIFGPVKNPYYLVRYNSENEVPTGIQGGTSVSFVPEFANHVLNNKDLYKKGYDTSGLNDEEVSDEAEFSDDEREVEYMKQKMTKRGVSDQNPRKQKNNKRIASQKGGARVPSYPVTPAAPSLDHEKFSPFSGIRRGPFGATSVVPPFPPTSAGPNLASTGGVWTNGISLQRPQSALLPSGLPPNGISWFPGNAQSPYQFPTTGIPFQQQLGPSLGSLPTTMFPGVQSNIFAQPMYPRGLVGQNQMMFGLSSHIPQFQPPVCAGGHGFLPRELQSERNNNLHSSTFPDNLQASHQFRPGAFANHGWKNFHQRGRKGWRPAK